MSDAVLERLVQEVVGLRARVGQLERLENARLPASIDADTLNGQPGSYYLSHGALTGLEDDDHPQYQLANRTAEGARVYNSTAISIANHTSTALPFNSERWDTDNCHSTTSSTSRLYCNTPGWYIITGHVSFDYNPTGQRQVQISLNGSTTLAVHAQNANSAGGTHMSVACLYYLSAGQHVTLNVWQNSGGPLNIASGANYSPEFAMVRIA